MRTLYLLFGGQSSLGHVQTVYWLSDTASHCHNDRMDEVEVKDIFKGIDEFA